MSNTQDGHIYAITMPSSSSWSDLVEVNQEETEYQEEDTIQMESETIQKPEKRKADEENSEWTEVISKGKKQKGDIDKIELYISCAEQLPKQFALARLFKDNGITDILRVKYVNPYKVRLDMQSDVSVDRLEKCTPLLEKGWRIQRALEKSISYGVIRDVDLNLSDDDIQKTIACPKPAELLSIFRLNRRTSSEGWARSEAVRLCFKGAYLPPYIYVDSLRIKVDPYIFPVSQCAKCWKLGHPTKKCPSSKVVCPKCGENHANCDTKTYKCINCDGAHMALDKGCPSFIKEKRLRDIMAEFNCTYRKALTIYVAPEVAPKIHPTKPFSTFMSAPPLSESTTPSQRESIRHINNSMTTKAQIHNNYKEQAVKISQSSAKKQRSKASEYEIFLNPEPQDTNKPEDIYETVEEKEEREVTFGELIRRLKEIFFFKNTSILAKVTRMVKCCIDWIILVIVDNISDWPIIRQVFEFFVKNHDC